MNNFFFDSSAMLRNVQKSRDFAPQAGKNEVNLMFFEEKSGYFPPCFGRSENKGEITYFSAEGRKFLDFEASEAHKNTLETH